MVRTSENDICALCFQRAKLIRSHLIPSAVYKICRAPGANNQNPLMVTDDRAVQTSAQLQIPLLCNQCEDSLNKRGERKIIPLLARSAQDFPMLEALKRTRPSVLDHDLAAFELRKIRDFPVDELIHFAIGMYWKASVHSWNSRTALPRVELGAPCFSVRDAVRAKNLRRFVLGDGPLPEDITLSILLQPRPLIAFHLPFEVRGEPDDRTFLLYVPGLSFILSVGPGVSGFMRLYSLSGPLGVALVTDTTEAHRQRFRDALKTARVAPQLREKLGIARQQLESKPST